MNGLSYLFDRIIHLTSTLNDRLSHARCPRCGKHAATWKGGTGAKIDRKPRSTNYIYHCKNCGNTFVKTESDNPYVW